MSHVLILGCGYLGRRVAERLLQRGSLVSAVTRSRAETLRGIGIRPIVGDVTTGFAEPPPTADAVVYAVGMDRSAGKSMREVYVDGLHRALEWTRPIGRFVYVSSTGVYGGTDGGWLDESSPLDPLEASGKIVRDAEGLLRTSRPNAIILRCGGLYGPDRVIRRAAVERGDPAIGDPEKWINLIHVDDAACAVVTSLDCTVDNRTLNVVDDRPVTRRELYARTAELLGAPPARFDPSPAVAESGTAATAEPNRRIRNDRMKVELGLVLSYPTYETGLVDAIRPHSAAVPAPGPSSGS